MRQVNPSINHPFILNLLTQAKKNKKTIILPEGEDLRILQAACYCEQEDIAHCVLLGDKKKIYDLAKRENIIIPYDLEILNNEKGDELFINQLVELRRHKGLTRLMAQEQLHNNIVVAMMKLYNHQVDGLVAGAITSTGEVLKPALQIIKTQKKQLLSSLFFMCLANEILIYADCAINISPSATELATIALQTAASAQLFGISPKVALLSYSTKNSGQGKDVEKVRVAYDLIKEQSPDLLIDGPLQYDAAVDKKVAMIKAKDSMVAGKANVFIFPDLNSGNITYKAVQRVENCLCAGPMLQGLNLPVNDLSRGASVEEVIAMIAITVIQSSILIKENLFLQDNKEVVV